MAGGAPMATRFCRGRPQVWAAALADAPLVASDIHQTVQLRCHCNQVEAEQLLTRLLWIDGQPPHTSGGRQPLP